MITHDIILKDLQTGKGIRVQVQITAADNYYLPQEVSGYRKREICGL